MTQLSEPGAEPGPGDVARGGRPQPSGRPPSTPPTSPEWRTDDGEPSAEDRRYQRLLLVLVMLAVMTFGSLMTIVTVSLDVIAADVGSTRATLTWMITGLMLAMAVATPIAGKLGDIRGHRRMFLAGLLGGVAFTLASAAAWDATSLIAFRVLFGLSGAMMMPSGMALMMQAYGPSRRATAMGWYQFAMTGAPTIGLVVGGPLIDVVGWRALFVGFAGVTAVALGLGQRILRPTVRQDEQPIDYLGAAALGVAVLAGLLALTRVTNRLQEASLAGAATDPILILSLVVAGATGLGFVAIERRSPAPMLDLSYFGRRNFTLPMVASALMQFAYMGGFVVTPALLGDLYGMAVGAIALMMVPRPGVFSLASPVGGYLASRIGEKRPIILGTVLMVASMACFAGAALVDVDQARWVGLSLAVSGLALSGASAGLSQPAVAAMVAGSVDEADIGIANGMTQQLTFIGIVSGIQTMNVLVGEAAGPARFAATFAVGLVAAALAMVAALGVDGERT